MNLSDEIDLEDYISRPEKISGADINAICQEVCLSFVFIDSTLDINSVCTVPYITNLTNLFYKAGMQAVRENRYVVLGKDFEKGYKNNTKKDEQEHEFYR